jgi:hypothetical protein
MGFPKVELSLSSVTPFCHGERKMLYGLITELRNGSWGPFQRSDLGREPTCGLCTLTRSLNYRE